MDGEDDDFQYLAHRGSQCPGVVWHLARSTLACTGQLDVVVLCCRVRAMTYQADVTMPVRDGHWSLAWSIIGAFNGQ